MKTNVAAASYHSRILSPKYGQTGNVKPLTANRSLSFAVKWPNLDLKDSISWLHWYLKMSWMKKQHRRAKQADRNSGEATAQVASLADIFLIWARFLPFPPLQNLVLGYAGASCKPEFATSMQILKSWVCTCKSRWIISVSCWQDGEQIFFQIQTL